MGTAEADSDITVSHTHRDTDRQEEGEDDTFIARVFFCLVAATLFLPVCAQKEEFANCSCPHTHTEKTPF